ncbi:hypothetical protein HDE_09368 [Halotydeus destructor]|nr:hypothetical protein HDE_09368 [Halotydeus destructor]
MSWIVPYLERYDHQLYVTCDINQLSGGSRKTSLLRLDQLLEHELISIFRWLKPKPLVSLERVSKKFFDIVAKTFQELEYFDVQDCEIRDDSNFKTIAFLNRFGPSLRVIPFMFCLSDLSAVDRIDAKYLKRLAWRFPEVSDVGPINGDSLMFLLIYLKAFRDKSKVCKLYPMLELDVGDLANPGTVTMFSKWLKAIVAECPKLDKLYLTVSTVLDFTLIVNGQQFLHELGSLSLELSTRVSQLVLCDIAACALQELSSRQAVNLHVLKLRFHNMDYCHDDQVRQLCIFAPNVQKLELKADVPALRHLVVLTKLSAIYFSSLDPNQALFSASRQDAMEYMGMFLKTVGKKLKSGLFCLRHPNQRMPILKWLSRYCPDMSKLELLIRYHVMFSITGRELDVVFQNNVALKFMQIICYDDFTFHSLEKSVKQEKFEQLRHRSLTVDVKKRF